MKNKTRKNKLIIIAMIFYILVSLFFNSKSYASDDTSLIVTLPSINEIVGKNDNWIILKPDDGPYNLRIYDGNITYTGNYYVSDYETGNPENVLNWVYDTDHFRLRCSSGTCYRGYVLDENNSWTLSSIREVEALTLNFPYDLLPKIVANNFDLRNNLGCLGNNDVVFQKATTLSTLTGTHLNQETWQAIKMMVMIMVAVIGLLIFLIGLKKGLRILVNGLKI